MALIEKSASTNLFLTLVKAKVGFETFEPLGMNYTRDKNRYYYGSSAKVINEDHLQLFYDETYRAELIVKLDADIYREEINLKIWNSKVAISQQNVYWNGILKKELGLSLKRVTRFFYIDDSNVYYYNLQTLKKLEGVDKASVIYENYVSNSGYIKSLICDKYKPIHCYLQKSEIDPSHDFEVFEPLFEKYVAQLTKEYWWFQR